MRIICTLCAALLLGLWFGSAQAAPTCWPSDIGGTGGPASYTVANKTGPAAGWHCPDNSDWIYATRWGDVTPAMGQAMEAVLSSADRQAAAAALVPFATQPLAQVFEVWQQFATWKPVVAEGQTIKVSGPVVLRFGVDTRWVIKTNVWSDIACTNAAFTVDPAPGVVKGCEVALFVGQPIPTPAPVYTHRVKVNGTAADRPASTLVNGVRSAITGFRAKVGQPCDTTKPTAPSTGTDLWARYGPDFPSTLDGKPLVALCEKQ